MRQIEFDAVKAFNAGKRFKRSNTEVTACGRVYLHGNLIVQKFGSGLMFTLAGWGSVTTRSRINAFLPSGIRVGQKNYEQVLRVGDTEKAIDPAERYVVDGGRVFGAIS